MRSFASTITLSDDECELVLDNLWLWDQEELQALPFGERGQALATLAALERTFALRDELAGWPDSNPHPPRAASVTPELVELLVRIEREATAEAVHERESLGHAAAGDRDYWYADTLEQTVAMYETQISRYERERDLSAAILDRLGVRRVAVIA